MSTVTGFHAFADQWQPNARLALDTIDLRPTRGIPTWMFQTMQWSQLEALSGNPPGSYPQEPVRVYRDFMVRSGVCYLDQWIPENPLSLGDKGYEKDARRSATTGAEEIVRDGRRIDSPEAAVEHLEQCLIPQWLQWRHALETSADEQVRQRLAGEVAVQQLLGLNVLKGPYGGFFTFPGFLYGHYGYANYFMAYALYPEVIERAFRIYADAAVEFNRIAARAIVEGGLPRLLRLDHDMADSRGLLVDVKTLDRLWLPHFARAIQPFLDAGIRLIWHCDGNLMDLVPRLLEVGLSGFQGFQYEDGMDYERICRLTDRDGKPLLIIAGVSVTRTLPLGKPADVRRQMAWLVEKGPKVGLMLGCSSSITPGVPLENLQTLIEGFAHYRQHGRG